MDRMKASDTVMHLDEVNEGKMPDSYASLRKALEKQAEITWKACKQELDKKWRQILRDSIAVAKLAGIKENRIAC